LSKLETNVTYLLILQAGTEQFHRAAVKIKRKKFWENMKMKIIIGVIIAVIIIIIIIMATSG
jgi:vesicle-associated membrane protein 4